MAIVGTAWPLAALVLVACGERSVAWKAHRTRIVRDGGMRYAEVVIHVSERVRIERIESLSEGASAPELKDPIAMGAGGQLTVALGVSDSFTAKARLLLKIEYGQGKSVVVEVGDG